MRELRFRRMIVSDLSSFLRLLFFVFRMRLQHLDTKCGVAETRQLPAAAGGNRDPNLAVERRLLWVDKEERSGVTGRSKGSWREEGSIPLFPCVV